MDCEWSLQNITPVRSIISKIPIRHPRTTNPTRPARAARDAAAGQRPDGEQHVDRDRGAAGRRRAGAAAVLRLRGGVVPYTRGRARAAVFGHDAAEGGA